MQDMTRAFTLIELLLVIAIIGVLAAVLVPSLFGARAKANDSATMSYMRHCASALEISRDPLGYLPSNPPPSNCEDARLAQTKPGSVQQTQITITENNTSYTISALSQTGKTFTYDQNGFR